MASALFESQREQFVGSNGLPIVQGRLYIGLPDQDPETSPKTVYADRGLTTPLAQPILLDQNGRTTSPVWVDSSYSYVVQDRYGNRQVEQPYIEVLDIQQIIDDALASLSSNPNLLINGGMQFWEGAPVGLTDTLQQGQVSGFWGRVTGVTAGTLTYGRDAAFSRSGFHAAFSGVDTASTGNYLEFQARLESQDGGSLANAPASFAVLVEHDKGPPVECTLSVGIPSSQDDFSAITNIATSVVRSAASAESTRIEVVVDDMGDSLNGVAVTLRMNIGVVSDLNVKLSEFQAQAGVVTTPFTGYEYDLVKAAMTEDRAVGSVVMHLGTTARRGTLIGNGDLVLRADFPRLWKYANDNNLVYTEDEWQDGIGVLNATSVRGAFSDGDGSTTFRLPDLISNSPFFRTFDPEGFRIIGSYQSDAIKEHAHDSGATQFGDFTSTRYPFGQSADNITAYTGHPNPETTVKAALTNTYGTTETRPKNYALLPCIVY